MSELQRFTYTDDELVGALDALDVPFLSGGALNDTARALAAGPAVLLQGLAQSEDARVRSALIPLLLRHPEFSNYAQVRALCEEQNELPDSFGGEVGLEMAEEIHVSLVGLGKRNAELRGLELNWVGTDEHAARSWLEYLKWQEKRKKIVWQVN